MTDLDPRFVEAEEMLRELIPRFAGVDADVVGSVLGELVALFLAGHNPAIRSEVLLAFISMVNDLTGLLDARESSPWPKQTRQ